MSKKAQNSNGAARAAAKTNPINNTSAEDKENTAIAAVVRNLSIFWDGPGRGKSDALGYLWELERESKEAEPRNRFLSFHLGGTGRSKSDALAYLRGLERVGKEAAARNRGLSFHLGGTGGGKSKAAAVPSAIDLTSKHGKKVRKEIIAECPYRFGFVAYDMSQSGTKTSGQ